LEDAPALPSVATLAQNYPNPFNPETVITYNLSLSTEVNLSIYNIFGQKIATLVDQNQAAGEHTVRWNATDFSSGIYLYRLRAGAFEQSRRMILLR
jgi:hypothetical protein